MAGPGDNTRAKAQPLPDSEPFKRALTACTRAIAGDHELDGRPTKTGREGDG